MEPGAGAGTSTGEEGAPRRPALPWKVRLMLFVLDVVGSLSMRRAGTINRFVFSFFDCRARPACARTRTASGPPTWTWTRRAACGCACSRSPRRRPRPRPHSPSWSTSTAARITFALLSAASVPYDAMCRWFCHKLRAVVVSVDYRLAPEHRCPAAYEDGVDVLRHLANEGLPGSVTVPVDLSRCFLAGDSAGANIAHHVAQRWTTTAGVASSSSSPSRSNSNPFRIAGVVLVQPYFGGEERTDAEGRLDGKVPVVTVRGSDWMWRAFLPEGADRNHPAAHVSDENAGLADGFPPAMLVIGGLDPLQDWQRRYADVLGGAGGGVPGGHSHVLLLSRAPRLR